MPRVRQDVEVGPGDQHANDAGDPGGLVCRACGCRHFRVVYVKRIAAGLLRVRECRHCGKRMRTRETSA